MVIFAFKRRQAVIQIPVLIGLLVMAIAVPVATKLVQENQDTRNRAATCKATGASCSTGGVPCCSGKCSGGKCVANSVSPTSRPAATATPKPSCSSSGQWCDGDWMCCAGLFCNSNERCQESLPANTPTTKPTSTPTKAPAAGTCGSSGTISQCGGKGGCSTGYRCLPNGCSYDPACGGFVPTSTPTKAPTATPTKKPTATPTPTCLANGRTTTSAGKCCTGYAAYINSSLTCTTKPTSTPTKAPTATPTKAPAAGICGLSGTISQCGGKGGCSTGYRCLPNGCSYDPACGGFVPTSTPTKAPTATPKPCNNTTCASDCSRSPGFTGSCVNGTCKCSQVIPTATPTCLANGRTTTSAGKCCTGYAAYINSSLTCTTKPTSTPTKAPTATPKPCNNTTCASDCSRSPGFTGSCVNGTCKCSQVIPTVAGTCGSSGTISQCGGKGGCSTGYRCLPNGCSYDPACGGFLPTPSPPTTCIPNKGECTGSKGLAVCNSQGNGYKNFTCGVACLWGGCIGEKVAVVEPLTVENCLKYGEKYQEGKCCEGLVKATTPYGYICGAQKTCASEYKCEANGANYYEYKCNSNGYYDQVKRCDNGCENGRCKGQNCIQEGGRYQEGNGCCGGLVKTSTYGGIFCLKQGNCIAGNTKCENGVVWECNSAGYYDTVKKCDFGCSGNACQVSCLPRSARCLGEKTLQVCSDGGTAWNSRSCNYCNEGICYKSKEEAKETQSYSADWDGVGPLPYCYAPSHESVGLNTCPEGYICGSKKVEDRNGLYYCEKKTAENSTVKVCVPNTSFCGQGGVLLQCSADGNRWAGAWQCPAARPEKGAQYNYSCKQLTNDRGQCRPATPEEGRDTAVEIVGITAGAVASVLALPAVIANIPATMVVAGGVNSAYSIGNAVYNCQYWDKMTDKEKQYCIESGVYAGINTGSAILGGANFGGISNAATVYGGLAVSVTDTGMGIYNAVNVCEQSQNPTECYMAIGSAVINAVGLVGDVANASNYYQQHQLTNDYVLAMGGDKNAYNRLPENLKKSVIDSQYTEALLMNVNYDLAMGGDRNAYNSLPDYLKKLVTDNQHTEALLMNGNYDLALNKNDVQAYLRLPEDLRQSVLNRQGWDQDSLDDWEFDNDDIYLNLRVNRITMDEFEQLPLPFKVEALERAHDFAIGINSELNYSAALKGDRRAFSQLTPEKQKLLIADLQRHALYENWIRGYDQNALPSLDNIEVNIPALNPLSYSVKIDLDDPGIRIVLKEMDDISAGIAKDSVNLTPEDLMKALYVRNRKLDGYTSGGINDPWENGNALAWRSEGGATLGQSFTPDCPGNVCAQNAAMLQVSLSQHGFESEYITFGFTEKDGTTGAHAVTAVGGMILDPTWGFAGTPEKWRLMLADEGLTDIRIFDSLQITIPK